MYRGLKSYKKNHVYKQWALGLLFTSLSLWADGPIDLESPFLKACLIGGNNSEISEKIVYKGKDCGDLFEFEKEDGGLLVLPKKVVLAVLPKLPRSGTRYMQSDAAKALAVLEQAQKKYSQRPEVSPEAIAEWKRLAIEKTVVDQIEYQALEAWFRSSGEVSPQAKQEEIKRLANEGESFARKFPNQAEKIMEQVKGLRDLSRIDLSKTANLTLPLVSYGDNFVAGAILWALLLVPLVLIIQGISGAIEGFKLRLPLACVLRLLVVLASSLFLGAILAPAPNFRGVSSAESVSSNSSAQKALWLSRNLVEQWSDQASQRITISAEDWKEFLLKTIQPATEDIDSLFWQLERPYVEIGESRIILLQTVVMKFIPLHFKFTFNVPSVGQEWTSANLVGCRLGMLPLGTLIGGFALEPISHGFSMVRSGFGLDHGVRWTVGKSGSLLIEVPATHRQKPLPKETITAKELAEVFRQGFGEIYKDRYLNVEGVLEEVHSTHDTLGMGVLSAPDPLDEFYLAGIPANGGRQRIRICCKIKSQEKSYFLDGKGDLYFREYQKKEVEQTSNTRALRGQQSGGAGANTPIIREIFKAQNPNQNQSIFRKGGTVKFYGGRIESGKVEMEAVTLYDCQKLEGINNGETKIIWEAPKE